MSIKAFILRVIKVSHEKKNLESLFPGEILQLFHEKYLLFIITQEELAANKALGSFLSLPLSSHVETKTVAGGVLSIQ